MTEKEHRHRWACADCGQPQQQHGNAGEGSYHAKLTATDVAQIRTLYATGEWSQRQLADRFGVSGPNVHYIVTGRSWRIGAAVAGDARQH